MRYIDIKIRRRPLVIRGLYLKESKHWMVVNYNPVDYVLDGYCFINKLFVSEIIEIEVDSFKYKVMSLKKNIESEDDFLGINIDSDDCLYNSFFKEKTLIQIELESDEFAYIGFVSKLNKRSFILSKISVRGELIDETNFEYNKIRNIYIKTDYLNSLEKYIKYFSSDH